MWNVIWIGAAAAVVLSVTSGWLITGVIFHRFQSRTPHSWRAESWITHMIGMIVYAFAGAVISATEFRLGLAGLPSFNIVGLSLLLWLGFSVPVIALISTYVRIHLAVAVGLMLEWLIFIGGVSFACSWWVSHSVAR